MAQTFKRIILYARAHRANYGVVDTLNRLQEFLATKQIPTYAAEDTGEFFPETGLTVLDKNQMSAKTDLIVVVGGDGSLLSAARLAVDANVPVIGINRGRLGFLTDICPQDLEEQFGKVLAGDFIEEHRFLLHAQILNDNKTYFDGTALNDVVLMAGDEPHLIQFDVYINDQFVCHHRADGLIIATPTGSTAYALSAGGPILSPALEAVVMVPMFSHGLNSRPIVISSKNQIEIIINQNNEHEPKVSCDGHARERIKPGQKLVINKHQAQLRLLHPKGHRYYDVLREKLFWENRSVI